LAIELAGGEPFVNFKLFCDIVLYIEQKCLEFGRNVQLYTQTNGSTVTPKIVDFLKKHEISVGVSIDGPADLHNSTRPRANGKGSFDQVMRGISLLRNGGIRFGIITVLTRHNAKHAERMVQFFSELGSRSVKINPVNLIGDADNTWNAVGISGEEYFEFLDAFLDASLQAGIKLKEANLAECIKNLVFRVREYRCMRSNCGAGQTFFVIDSRGDLFPCAHSTAIESWKLGSLVDAERAGGFAALGAGSEAVNAIARRRVDDMPATRSCRWRHFCEGGCAVNAFKAHGTIASQDPLCSFYEKMYPRLFQRLATSPGLFQHLLDGQLGAGVARTETFLLNNHA
jgi:radical SAM protein with 4Fe4S-binding SPASM domain